MRIPGDSTASGPSEIEETIWERLHFASHLRTERLGEFTIGTDLHRSESLALIQLLILYHLFTGAPRWRWGARSASAWRREPALDEAFASSLCMRSGGTAPPPAAPGRAPDGLHTSAGPATARRRGSSRGHAQSRRGSTASACSSSCARTASDIAIGGRPPDEGLVGERFLDNPIVRRHRAGRPAREAPPGARRGARIAPVAAARGGLGHALDDRGVPRRPRPRTRRSARSAPTARSSRPPARGSGSRCSRAWRRISRSSSDCSGRSTSTCSCRPGTGT